MEHSEVERNKVMVGTTKLVLWEGDITTLKIGAVVNATNDRLQPGGGICGAVYAAAGQNLQTETDGLESCETGKVQRSGGFDLPATHIIHAVGPKFEKGREAKEKLLSECHLNTLDACKTSGINSVALCCISVGIYHGMVFLTTKRR